MYSQVHSDAVNAETDRVIDYTQQLISAYQTVGDELRYNTASTFCMDAFVTVTLRIEAACSCLLLAQNGLVADTLGLADRCSRTWAA